MIPRRIVTGIGLALAGAFAALQSGASDGPSRGSLAPAAAPDVMDSTLWMEMRNVDMHIDEQHLLHMRSLRGQVIPATPGALAWLDDPKSFHIRVTSGIVALDGE